MKSVFITGHTSGLGRRLMEEFLDTGWRVFAIARGAATLAEAVGQSVGRTPGTGR